MALGIDIDRKPTLAEWLAEDVWFAGMLRDVLAGFRAGYDEAHAMTSRRFGKQDGPAGPQVKARR